MKCLLGFLFNRGANTMSDRIKTVDAATVMEWLKEGAVTVVDVREPHEHQAARIPGAVSVPLSSFDPGRVPVESGKHLVFHCQSGRRCGPASEQMVRSGFTGEVNRLGGGMNAWLAASGPVER